MLALNNHISCTNYLVCRVQQTYHQNYRYNCSTTFKLMSYDRSIGEIQGHGSWPDIHAPPDCYVANQYTTVFRVSSIPCIGCNRCHLTSEWVSGYVLSRKW